MKSDKLGSLKSYKSWMLAGIIISIVGALIIFTPSGATVSASSNLVSASPNSYAQQLEKTFKQHKILKLDRAKVAKQVRQTGKLSITTPEESFELELTPHDMRAADYYAEEVVEGGATRRLEPATVKTFRGKAHGLNEAESRFTIDENKFEGAMITRGDIYVIEPARKYAPLADQSDFVFYKASDVEPDALGTCAATLDKEITQTGERVLSEANVSNLTTGDAVFSPNLDTQLATEADYEFVTAKGGSTAANDEILSIMNQVEGVYQAQLGITFSITVAAQHTWNTASDPYTATDSSALLDEFKNYWNANFSSIGRDLAHLWTGKDLDGTTVGVAWLGVVCRNPSLSYGLSQILNNSPGKFILTAHEIGHNFGANHADTTAHTDCANTIMQSSVGTGFAFCQSSIDEITAYVNLNSSCLSRSTTTTTRAAITSPVNGATLSTSTVTFTWGPVSSGVSYYFDVGNTQGSRDIYGAAASGGSTTVSGLPADGRRIYVRLWTLIDGVWQYNDYSYLTTGVTAARITSPANGATFTSSTTAFTWGPVSSSATYYLDLSSSPGSRDIFANYVTGGASLIGGIPLDGRTVYARLWSLIGGVWSYNEYTYRAASSVVKAAITSPVNGATFASSTVTFTWNTVAGATQYFLDLSSSTGSRDIYANYVSNSPTTVSGIPTDGRTIYVRLWTLINGAWQFNEYTYRASTSGSALISSPVNGSTFTSSTVTFTWNTVAGASQYFLDLNTSPGSRDIFANYVTGGSSTVTGIPTDGRIIYVRLWTNIGGVWVYNAYTYTAKPTP
jgi:metallopeptidase family M12-like protein